MAHQETITDVPKDMVETIKQRMEQRGGTVEVTEQADGLFTISATYAESAALAALDAAALAPAGVGASLTESQAKAAKAIINIFETSEVLGDYSKVTLIPGDTGHLTYGRSQTTLGSGNLHRLLTLYVSNPGAAFRSRILPFLARTKERDTSLDDDLKFQNALRAAADDRVMRETQDQFFDAEYWRRALHESAEIGVFSPLGVTVVYDGCVHGSWHALRDKTNSAKGSVQRIGERVWIAAYVSIRREWLATHERHDLRPTVYRMDAVQRLIDQGFWGLELPLVVRGKEISTASLGGTPPNSFDSPQPGTRTLALGSPLQMGLDVRLVQLGLSDANIPVKADGLFGKASRDGIKAYQSAQGLPPTGVADIALVASLTSNLFA